VDEFRECGLCGPHRSAGHWQSGWHAGRVAWYDSVAAARTVQARSAEARAAGWVSNYGLDPWVYLRL
jgi:hypothetical protein